MRDIHTSEVLNETNFRHLTLFHGLQIVVKSSIQIRAGLINSWSICSPRPISKAKLLFGIFHQMKCTLHKLRNCQIFYIKPKIPPDYLLECTKSVLG